MKRKVLVTGSAGFIGFHLVQLLLSKGFIVTGIDNINSYYDVNLKHARLAESGIFCPVVNDYTDGKNRQFKELTYGVRIVSVLNPDYSFIRMNIENKEAVFQLFESDKFDYVVNLAAQAGVRYSIENPDAYIQSNIVGFMNILEACRYFPVKHLVYASSSSVYGDNDIIPFVESSNTDKPLSLYAATKKSNELMAYAYNNLYNIRTTGLRFFTVYGPWGRPDMAPMLFARAISEMKTIQVFNNGNMERDFTYINDIIEGIFCVLSLEDNKTETYKILNIGNGKPVNLLHFIELIEKSMGKMANKEFKPLQLGDVHKTYADTSELNKLTGFQPKTTIENGVPLFVSWYKSYYL
jgi:UDP-glucuronate 4-epimerase